MNSIAFSVGPFDISWYSICILVGVMLAWVLFALESKKYEINSDFCTNLVFWTIIFGIVGARLYYVAFNLDYYLKYPIEILKIWNGGLAIHGGILFGFLFILFYSKKYQIRTLKITDMLVVGLIIAQALGRWGNFFNGEAHGPVVSRETLENMKIIPDIIINNMRLFDSASGTFQYFHPTFYYESLWCVLGFIVLLAIRIICKKIKCGQLTSIYMIWYGIGRFFIESMRTDSLMLGSIKIAQLVSVLLVLGGLALFFIKKFRKSDSSDLYDSYEVDNVQF